MARDPLHERILGSLLAAALGDALGAPTEGCSRAEITQRYGGLVRGFQPRAADVSAVGAVGLRPGEVTDDTSQLLAFARALVACEGELDAARWTAVLREWLLTSPKARLAGPSTSRLLHSGEERPSGWLDNATIGATNGAAMRGAQLGETLGAREGRLLPGHSVADQIELAVSAGAGTPSLEAALERIATRVGSSGLAVESVPAAIGVFAAARGRPYEAIVAGASIGGDCDTIASRAGALAGAFHGLEGVPADLLARFAAANDEDLAGVAEQLYELARHRTS